MFGNFLKEEVVDKIYTSKIEAPIYTPRDKKPHIMELVDKTKTIRLIDDIEKSQLPEDEKKILISAAHRHTVFNYENIADYYAQASPEMQKLMEDSALIIIDFDKAIELGYVNLCDSIQKEYLEEYSEEEII